MKKLYCIDVCNKWNDCLMYTLMYNYSQDEPIKVVACSNYVNLKMKLELLKDLKWNIKLVIELN